MIHLSRQCYMLLCVIILVTCACNPKEERNIETFVNNELACINAYISSDVDIAEQGLLEFRDVILDYKKQGVKGINYNHALGLVDARLYLIYKKKGNVEEARYYLEEGIRNLSNKKDLDEGDVEEEEEKLTEFIEKLDSNLEVKWKVRKATGGKEGMSEGEKITSVTK